MATVPKRQRATVDVFRFRDYRGFLAAFYAARKAHGFSYQAFANAAGLGARNYLKLVTDGKRIEVWSQRRGQRTVVATTEAAPGATVRDSIVMTDATIEAGAEVDRSILDKRVLVAAGAIWVGGPVFAIFIALITVGLRQQWQFLQFRLQWWRGLTVFNRKGARYPLRNFASFIASRSPSEGWISLRLNCLNRDPPPLHSR